MAYIITAEGKLMQGAVISDEEAGIISEITSSFKDKTYGLHYERDGARESFAADLVSKYHITRRESAPAVEPLEFREVAA